MRPFYLVRRRRAGNHIYQIMARQKELHPKSFTQIPSQIPKAGRKKQSQTRNEVPLPEKGTLPVPNCGATKVANVNLTSRPPAKPSTVETPEHSELLKFGSMITSSMNNLQQTLTKQFENLQSTMARPWFASYMISERGAHNKRAVTQVKQAEIKPAQDAFVRLKCPR